MATPPEAIIQQHIEVLRKSLFQKPEKCIVPARVYVSRDGHKLKKDPVSFVRRFGGVTEVGAVSYTNQSNWMSFDEYVEFKDHPLNLGSVIYPGVVLAATTGIIILDFDNHDRIPDLDVVQQQQIKYLQSIVGVDEDFYVERSISGSGYHVIINGDWPYEGQNAPNFQVFNKGGFVVLTGDDPR